MSDLDYLTWDEVAKRARRSRQTLYNMRARGEGPRVHKVGGRLLVSRTDFEEWMNSFRESREPSHGVHGGEAA